MVDACAEMWDWLAQPENVGKLKADWLRMNVPVSEWPSRHCYYCALAKKNCEICIGTGIIWKYDPENPLSAPCTRDPDSPYGKWEQASIIIMDSMDPEWDGDVSMVLEARHTAQENAKIMAEKTKAISILLKEKGL